MLFVVVFSVTFVMLVAGAHSAAIPHDSIVKAKPASYLAAVHYGDLPEDGMYYEYIQPLAVLDRAVQRTLEQHHERRRREVSTSVSAGSDGTSYMLHSNTPIVDDGEHSLSADLSAIASTSDVGITAGAGLNYDHIDGHGASLSGKHISGYGNQLTAAGRLNLLNTEDHRLDANAFHTRTFLENNGPTLKTTGGSLDYLYNDRHGASLGVSHTDLFDSTTYSGAGKLNLYQSPSRDTSFDFNTAISKTTSPFMRSSGWEPSFGFSLSKSW